MSVRLCPLGLTSRACRMIPAPTVSLDTSSIRMNAPLSAVVGVWVGDQHRAGAQGDRADVVERQLNRAVHLVEGLGIELGVQLLHGGPHRAGALLEGQPVARAQRVVEEPAHRRVQSRGPAPAAPRPRQPLTKTSPRPTSMSSASSIETDSGATPVPTGRHRGCPRPSRSSGCPAAG